jgi:hypothetical protein
MTCSPTSSPFSSVLSHHPLHFAASSVLVGLAHRQNSTALLFNHRQPRRREIFHIGYLLLLLLLLLQQSALDQLPNRIHGCELNEFPLLCPISSNSLLHPFPPARLDGGESHLRAPANGRAALNGQSVLIIPSAAAAAAAAATTTVAEGREK